MQLNCVAGVAELADAPDLESGVMVRAGSIPAIRTMNEIEKEHLIFGRVFFLV